MLRFRVPGNDGSESGQYLGGLSEVMARACLKDHARPGVMIVYPDGLTMRQVCSIHTEEELEGMCEAWMLILDDEWRPGGPKAP